MISECKEMPTNVNAAFNKFLAETVNLLTEDSKTARIDRDNLRGRIQRLEAEVQHFPTLKIDADINFGSFSRKTKKRPLDDVDMFFCMSGNGAYYNEGIDGVIKIHVTNTNTNLYMFTNNDNETLNSIKVLNKFKSSVESIYAYRSSEINRRQEVVKLTLNNKDWSFDIVPCFITTAVNNKNFYLIPDGTGNWKKADPRIDQERTTRINQSHDGKILNIIRIMKYWNARATMPTMSSYLLENIILNHYENRSSCSEYIDLELPHALEAVCNAVFYPVPDPKGFQSDLNQISYEDRCKIYIRAGLDKDKAVEAHRLEIDCQTHRECISKWREIFGYEFPVYN